MRAGNTPQKIGPNWQKVSFCYRIQFPKDMDANAYALKMNPPDKALALLIRKAEWMAGKTRASDKISGGR